MSAKKRAAGPGERAARRQIPHAEREGRRVEVYLDDAHDELLRALTRMWRCTHRQAIERSITLAFTHETRPEEPTPTPTPNKGNP